MNLRKWVTLPRRFLFARGYQHLSFLGVRTLNNPAPLYSGRFGALYERHHKLDPHFSADQLRYRVYNVCMVAWQCRNIPGDFLSAGVSYGVAQHMVYDFVDVPRLGKTLHMIDPFTGTSPQGKRVIYNTDVNYIRRQYSADASIVIHQQVIPRCAASKRRRTAGLRLFQYR
jgi:hypothetical protein